MNATRVVRIRENIFAENTMEARDVRSRLSAAGTIMVNVMASPGAGKTSLILRGIEKLRDRYRIAVIEADLDSTVDADKITAVGLPAVQIETGGFCHVDSKMVQAALREIDPASLDLIFLENVGNLICPAQSDTGAHINVAILSVPEGDDKPLKYPTMFETSDICIINKTDLLPYVDFDVAKTREYALRVNPKLQFFELSVKTGEGMEPWIEWLLNKQKELNN